MSPDEFYKAIRDQIVHEDNLCNQRMTWLITLQAFLFGAYGFSLSAESNQNGVNLRDTIITARTGMAMVGILSSLVVIVALFAAKRSIDRLVDRWYDSYPEEAKTFPQIIGNYAPAKRRGTRLGQVPIFSIPIIFPLVWLYIQFGNSAAGFAAAGLAGIVALVFSGYMGALIDRRRRK